MTHGRLPVCTRLRFAILPVLFFTALGAQAAPNGTVNTATVQTSAADGSTAITDTDTVPPSEAALDSAITTSAPPTLKQTMQPSNQDFSAANQQLLTRNAALKRQVNDLQTQVNVLIYESQGQLFLYGALTSLISLMIGALVTWLILSRRSRW